MVELAENRIIKEKFSALITQRERKVWENTLNTIDHKNKGKLVFTTPPQYVTSDFERKANQKGFYLVITPGLEDFGSKEDLAKLGPKKFQEKLSHNYPGLKHINSMYFESMNEGNIEFPDVSSATMLIEDVSPLPPSTYRRSQVSLDIKDDMRDRSFQSISSAIAKNERKILEEVGLENTSSKADKLLPFFTHYLLQHREEVIGITGNEWTSTKLNGNGEEYQVFTGKSSFKNTGEFDFDTPDFLLNLEQGAGYRLAIILK